MKEIKVSRIVWLIILAMFIAGCGTETAENTTAPTAVEETASQPTEEPTEEPTKEPTVAPVEEATAVLTEAPVEEPTEAPAAEAPSENLVDGCVEAYDETVDYFPEKTSFDYAERVSVEYFNNYKTVTVMNPWQTEDDFSYTYILVQCGTPAPEGVEAELVIEVPVQRFVSMSTTQLPQLEMLDELDSLVGIEGAFLVSSPEVLAMVADGEVAEIGTGADVNLEVALDLEPDLVMAFGYGSPDYDVEPFLTEAGIPTVLSADYLESSPLGRSEWLKFMALFFNKEATANKVFEAQAETYEGLLALTAGVEERPTVFLNTPFGGTWFMPQGQNYTAQLLADAGADYLWADEPGTASVFLDFEAVFERAVDAEYWINPSATWNSLADALAEDERYADFAAFENGVYNNNALVTELGGNDYWERGVTQPELILADLIAIFHPELLPDHELIFYQHLQ